MGGKSRMRDRKISRTLQKENGISFFCFKKREIEDEKEHRNGKRELFEKRNFFVKIILEEELVEKLFPSQMRLFHSFCRLS